jgi:hypothetical protein
MGAYPSPAAERAGPYSYAAYGLGLRSSVPLPTALPHDGVVDVVIRPEPLSQVTADLAARGAHTWVTRGEAHLRLPQIGTFLIRSGVEVLVDPDPEADDGLLQLAILGPVLATLLQQRGGLVLHASAVEMAGAAVGFLGTRGAGKSTTAAALGARGFPLLADDMLAVWLANDEPRVARGLPQLKLWPDAVRALGGDPDLLPPIHALIGKRAQRADESFCGRPALPLACLYVLCGGEAIRIAPLPPREAFLQIVAHSYGIEWLHETSGPEQFRDRAELVRRIPVRLLQRPSGLELIPRLARLVEEDLGSP